VSDKEEKIPAVVCSNALVFVCDNCGRDSFHRIIMISPDEAKELGLKPPSHVAEPPEIDEDVLMSMAGQWERWPTKVSCTHCGTCYRTVNESWDESDDGDGGDDLPDSSD
jgi:hypothetical protein